VTKLEIKDGSLFELEIGDQVRLGDVKYSVSGFTRGGMGFILFLDRIDSLQYSKLSIHGKRVVVKSALGTSTPGLDKLFLKELVVWSGFDHFNIITLNEIIEIDDTYAATMDWCHGSLRDYLRSNGSLSVEIAVHITQSIIHALSYANKTFSVHHLDLKPENILFDMRYTPYGKFMVSDWGISSVRGDLAMNSKVLDQDLDGKGGTMNNVGTIPYMAPERFHKGFSSSSASDVFSVGIMFFELITSKLPFDGNIDVSLQILNHAYMENIERYFSSNKNKKVFQAIHSMVTPDLSKRINDYGEIDNLLRSLISPNNSLINLFTRK